MSPRKLVDRVQLKHATTLRTLCVEFSFHNRYQEVITSWEAFPRLETLLLRIRAIAALCWISQAALGEMVHPTPILGFLPVTLVGLCISGDLYYLHFIKRDLQYLKRHMSQGECSLRVLRTEQDGGTDRAGRTSSITH